MKKILNAFILGVVFLILGANSVHAADELLVNGGFEDPVVENSKGWDIYDSGTEGLGWTVEWYGGSTSYQDWTRPEPAHLELHKSGLLVPANSGNQYAELDTDWDGPDGNMTGEPASIKIYQGVQTCVFGEYELTFSYAKRNADSMIEAYWNGEKLDISGGVANGAWTTVTIPLTAGDGTTRLEFVETGTADSLGMLLDSVSLMQTRSCDSGCTYTQGYWKNHSENWLTNDNEDWLEILETPVKGNAWYILAHQYIAAMLNVESGAYTTEEVSSTLTEAGNLLGDVSFEVTKSEKANFVELAEILTDFNEGFTIVPHCSE